MSVPEPLKPRCFQILLALADRDLHGLEIMKEVLERTGGTMHLWPGMLYGSLKAMVADGLVAETEAPPEAEPGGGRPRYYAITAAGRSALADEARRMESYVRVARKKNALSDSEPA